MLCLLTTLSLSALAQHAVATLDPSTGVVAVTLAKHVNH